MTFSAQFDIGGRLVGRDHPVFLIAEIGRNHNADMNLAREMIDAAVESGADAVKFQSFTAEQLLIKDLPKVSHIKETSRDKSAFLSTQEVELTAEMHRSLKSYCDERGVTFFSTPEDHSMVSLLDELGVPVFKIASLDVTYIDLVEAVAATGRPVILSTGMCYIGEVERALQTLHSHGIKDVALLHCTSNYPPRHEDVNLRAMETLSRAFGTPVGYSDHTAGIGVSIAAVALGACIIERHFTLDRTLPGPDQRLSLTPEDFKLMAGEIRGVEKALGSQRKMPVANEMEMRRLHRRRLVASRNLSQGTVLQREDIACKCSEHGSEPHQLPLLIGARIDRDTPKDAPLSVEDVIRR